MQLSKLVVVFGSNTKGIHSKGAAKTANNYYGAIEGMGEGLSGRSYAIPTKREPYVNMTIAEVAEGVNRFIEYAIKNPQLLFQVTKLGTGNSGFTETAIRSLFLKIPPNVLLPGT